MPPTIRDLLSAKLNLLPQGIYDVFPGVLAGRMLVIANRVGVFEQLKDHPKSAHEIASSISFDPNAVEIALNLLVSAGYLKIRQKNYSLTPQSRKWLLKDSPNNIGNFLSYIEMLHQHWMNLEETLKNGFPEKTYVELFSKKEWKIYMEGMSDLAKLILPYVLPKLVIPDTAEQLLDLGGSHGLYSTEICRRHPSLHATIIDFPEVIEHVNPSAHCLELADRITWRAGDLKNIDLERVQHDVVLAFNIIHGFDESENERLFQSISRTLKSCGKLFVLDQLKSDKHIGRGASALIPAAVGLNLMNEIGGNVYSFEAVKRWCQKAGMAHIKQSTLSLPGVALISARKQ
ncbi:MAG: methyltransferase [Bacteroidota bacterium]